MTYLYKREPWCLEKCVLLFLFRDKENTISEICDLENHYDTKSSRQ